MKKSQIKKQEIQDSKNEIITEINKIIQENIIPNELLDVELPRRIPLYNKNSACNDDVIISVKEGVIIINSLLNGEEIPLENLSLEKLVDILEELEKI